MDKIRINPRKDINVKAIREKLQAADIAAIGHYTEFGFMDPRIRCVFPDTEKIFGPAVTVRIPSQESKALHIAVSMAQEGDVIVIDRCGDANHACVGEMIALCSHARKLAGIVVDGPITDYEEIADIGIPVFATGVSALTTKFIEDCGEINYSISCGGVPVEPGDMIMADKNGVLVLREFELKELLDTALGDQEAESREKEEVLRGKTLQQLYVPEYPV
ncbi:RraA family protein [bacterium 210820-DFI.6.37]|nr:RraA family protein [bacterium 210820-DFI.6.37]